MKELKENQSVKKRIGLVNRIMQLELDFSAVVQQVVKPVPVCSVAEFREWQEVEMSYFNGRAAYLYKDLERWLNAEAKRKAELNRWFNLIRK